MLIGCKNPAPSRTYTVAGKQWAFTRPEANQPLRCDVDDPTASAVFLAPRNANLFFALQPAVAPVLTRAPVIVTEPPTTDPTPSEPVDTGTDTDTDTGSDEPPVTDPADIPAAIAFLKQSVRTMETTINEVSNVDLLRTALEIEASKTDPRSSIIAILDRRLKALA